MAKTKTLRCPTCKGEIVELKGASFNFFLFIILIFLGFLPGIVYYIYVKMCSHQVCVKCTADFAGDFVSDDRKKKHQKW